MFTVTDKAAEALRSILADADDRPEGHTLRIGFDQEGRPGLMWDEPAADDHEVQSGGETVLLLDVDTFDALDGVVLDLVDTPQGPRLSLSRPEG
ncbi:MAG: hypothetical protein D6791_17720 [Chloroflexi bacterium]|nr:MAG: hypothetical protein D6791_17720 [Chloroflexota bacterium]